MSESSSESGMEVRLGERGAEVRAEDSVMGMSWGCIRMSSRDLQILEVGPGGGVTAGLHQGPGDEGRGVTEEIDDEPGSACACL